MRRDEATLRREAENGYGEAGERELRQRDWAAMRGESWEPAPTPLAFKRLVWKLRARKYWKAKDPASKARIYAYRRRWALDHRETYRAAVNSCKRRRRKAKTASYLRELAQKRAKFAAKTAARKAATVYTCAVCGAEWKPGPGRLPPTPPKYCSQPCRSRANYLRGKAQGKAWARRSKAHRTARRAA